MKIVRNTFKGTLSIKGQNLDIISLEKVAEAYPQVKQLPFSIRILLKNPKEEYKKI